MECLLFKAYGFEHLIWLSLGVLGIGMSVYYGRRQPTPSNKYRLGLYISLFPAIFWALTVIYMCLFEPAVDLNLVLPFHVCYMLNLLLPLFFLKRSDTLFQIFYFVVMAGCIQALFTPDLQTDFPNFINFRYFIVHIGLVQSILYAVLVLGHRPTWGGFGLSYICSIFYLCFCFGVNYILGTNFMFLNRKPPSPNILDLFGPWPYYVFGAMGLALVLFAVVMSPFVFQRVKK
jgi:hypothetical integral membrane protein (TIGR02206 family)